MINIEMGWIMRNNYLSSPKDFDLQSFMRHFKPEDDGIINMTRDFYNQCDSSCFDPKSTMLYQKCVDDHDESVAQIAVVDRTNLYHNIKDHGQTEPLVVWMDMALSRYPIVDGWHRLFVMENLGFNTFKAIDLKDEVKAQLTYCFPGWKGEEFRIYQPVDLPGYEEFYTIRSDNYVRACSIMKYLDEDDNTFLDVGSNLGYMCRQITRENSQRHFTNIDSNKHCSIAGYLIAAMHSIYLQVYGNFIWGDFLNLGSRYDVVICLSLLHHYFRNEKKDVIVEVLQKLSSMTNNKLFLEIHPTIDIVLSEYDDVRGIFSDIGIEKFLQDITGARLVKPLEDVWGGRRLYFLDLRRFS